MNAHPFMARAEVIERARRCLGAGTRYSLGAGGLHPAEPFPWGTSLVHECDCSGFVAWCVGVARHLPDVPFYRAIAGAWFNTDSLVRDARSSRGFVDEIPWEDALPGDLVVYGGHKDAGDGSWKYGHVGLLTTPAPLHVIHCSKGNDRTHQDAIWEEPLAAWWKDRGALIARIAWVGGA